MESPGRSSIYLIRWRSENGQSAFADFATDQGPIVDDAARWPVAPVQEVLILAYQYMIVKYDVDGFRIDTLKVIEADFALSIGKRNVFTFGERFDGEVKINQFIGRGTNLGDEPISVDAVLDFSLVFKLPSVSSCEVNRLFISTHQTYWPALIERL